MKTILMLILLFFSMSFFQGYSFPEDKNIDLPPISQKMTNNEKSDYISCLYGKWEIVENLGFYGIYRTPSEHTFRVGDILTVGETEYKDKFVGVGNPVYVLELVSAYDLYDLRRMNNLTEIGIDFEKISLCAEIRVQTRKDSSVYFRNFFVISKDELVVVRESKNLFRAIRLSSDSTN